MRKYYAVGATWYMLLMPAICCGQSWEKFGGGIFSCKDRAGIIFTSDGGISYIEIDSRTPKWRAMSDNPPNLGPEVAGDTVAVVADANNTVYAFSKSTGKQVWKKNVWTSVLASDGKYFYVVRTAYWDLWALDPARGSIVWSLKLPDQGPGYLGFLIARDGLLFADNFVVDISKRAQVHTWLWSREGFFGDLMAFAPDGTIFRAGSPGMIASYDQNFNRISRTSVGKGYVLDLTVSRDYVVVLLDEHISKGRQTALIALTGNGNRLWRLRWPKETQGFQIAGTNLLMIEPGKTLMIEPGKTLANFRLASRQLSTGKLNWATRYGHLFGSPAVCGETVYVSDGHRLHGFDLQSGNETTVHK